MPIYSASICRLTVLALATLLADCPQKTSTAPPGQNDGTPPTVHLGSAGLATDIDLNQSATQPVLQIATRASSVLLVADASDIESGISKVTLTGDAIIECMPATLGNLTRVHIPISVVTIADAGAFPLNLKAAYQFKVADRIAQCPSMTRFYQLFVAVEAHATNGAALQQHTPEASIRVYGPDPLRVATLNLDNPGNWPDSQFVTWGTAIGSRADVVILTEVRDRRTAEILANAAGMPYVSTYQDNYFTDVAIASRAPLYNEMRLLLSSGAHGNNSYILSAISDIGGFPHQFVANHWATRDASGVDAGAGVSIQGRVDAANKVVGLLAANNIPVIVGGDFNAYADTAEIKQLTGASLIDVFTALGLPPEAHCSSQRIDFLFSRGPIVPVSYDGCEGFASPSDHPFVGAVYEPRPVRIFSPPARPPPRPR